MTDDRRRDAEPPAAGPITPATMTPGQRVARAFLEHASDSTLDMPAVTPALIAAGTRVASGAPSPSSGTEPPAAAVDPLAGTTLGMPPATPAQHAAPADVAAAGGTLDLPASDQVVRAGDLDPGQVLGHFVIRARLGEGGMGMVLAAHDADLGRPVALKVVKNAVDHPAYRARLLREAQAMARLEHPNVVRVYEVGSDRGRLFVAMELVDGVTLTSWLRGERRPWRAIVAIFEQVGAGLAAVHRAGLVHRDFKPDNVLVDRDGRARVADFGLARVDPDAAAGDPAFAASLTRTGMLLGTPGYMAPEQHFGGAVDARADQYSFCVALREALLGGRPTKVDDTHWGKVPRAVRAVIARGAAVDAVERFPSMEVLLVALSRATHRRLATIGGIAASVIVAGSLAAAVIVGTRSDDAPSPTTAAPTTVAAAATPRSAAGTMPAASPGGAGTMPAAAPGAAGTVPAASPGGAGTVPAAAPASAGLVPGAAGTRSTAPDTRAAAPSAAPRAVTGELPAAPDRGAGNLPTTTRAAAPSAAPRAVTGELPAAPDRGAGILPTTTRAAAPSSLAHGTSAATVAPSSLAQGPSAASAATAPTSSTVRGPKGAAPSSSGVTSTLVTPMAPPPVSKAAAARNTPPADKRHELVAAHRAAVRAAVRDLGYGGLDITGSDRDADLRDLEAKLAASTDDLERGALLYGMGQNERLRDNCIGAARYWRDARKVLEAIPRAPLDAKEQQRRTLSSRFYGRIVIAQAMCELTNGRALGIDEELGHGVRNLFGAADSERAHAWLAMAIVMIETGSRPTDEAKRLLLQAARLGDAKVRTALDGYVAATGLALP